jgi:hypothetical protein
MKAFLSRLAPPEIHGDAWMKKEHSIWLRVGVRGRPETG